MIQVVAILHLKETAWSSAQPLFAELIQKTRQEPGCLHYELTQDLRTAEPGTVVFLEQWESPAHLDAHEATEHFTRLLPQIGQLCAGSGTVLRLKSIL